MKKFLVLWICTIFLFSFFGCTAAKPNEKAELQSASETISDEGITQTTTDLISFIRIYDGKGHRCQWNIQEQTIDIGSEELFTYSLPEDGYAYPIELWDGNNVFTFYDKEYVEIKSDKIEYTFRSEFLNEHPGIKLELFGKNVNIYAYNRNIHSEGFIIDLFDESNSQTVELTKASLPAQIQEQLFGQDTEIILSFAHYEKNHLIIVFFIPQSHKVVTLIYDSIKEQWEGTESHFTDNIIQPKPSRSVLIQDTIFFMTGRDISSLNLTNFEYKVYDDYNALFAQQMHKFVTSKDFGYPILYDGKNDVLLAMLPISGGEYIENVTFAFKEGAYLGALHYRDGSIFTYDSEDNRVKNHDNLPCDDFQFPNNCSH